MKVIKRDGRKVEYNSDKIVIAISNANKEVGGKDKISRSSIEFITKYIESLERPTMSVEEIQDIIERKLMEFGKFTLAKKYILYRDKHALIRQANSTDENILSLVRKNSKTPAKQIESNRNTMLVSAQRDLIAEECSKDLVDRVMLPERIAKAHTDGVIFFHNRDYFVQPMHNSTYINIKDMLDNGTVINGKLMESPKSFQVACIIMSQIIAAISSSQYGGQTIDTNALGKYLKITFDKKYKCKYESYIEKGYSKSEADVKAKEDALEKQKEELASGVQTIQYQINTLTTTNGKMPSVTLFLHIDEEDEYVEENAMIIEEILKQRLQGIKNEKGEYITPETPRLVYVLDECNCLKGKKYDYLTKIAIECASKRMFPAFLSAKEMKKNHAGNVYSPMGDIEFLPEYCNEKGEYIYEGRFSQGVVTINLPQIGIIANGDEEKFWKLLDERLELCRDALLCRHDALLGTLSDASPLHWQYGAISRLEKGEKIDKLLNDCYSTLAIGYIGIYEVTKLMKGVSHTSTKGKEFATRLLKYMSDYADSQRESTGLGFILYGTPEGDYSSKLVQIDKERFGDIEDITDKGYYTNSFHIDIRESANVFDKLKFESKLQKLSLGGAISDIKLPDVTNNVNALLEDIIKYAYDNIQYVELVTEYNVF